MLKQIFISLGFLFIFLFLVIQAESAVITFLPRLVIEEDYTSNFFLTSDNEEYDFTSVVSPGFFTQLIGRSGNISLSYDPAYRNYSEHNQYNSWSHSAGITGTQQVTRYTTINFANSFLYTSEPLDTDRIVLAGNDSSTVTGTSSSRPSPSFDAGVAPSFDSSATSPAVNLNQNQGNQTSNRNYSRRGNREFYYTNNANLGLIHRFGINDSIRFYYSHIIWENDDPLIVDNQSHSPSFLLSYSFVPNQWRIETGGVYTRGLYDVDTNDFQSWEGDVKIFRQFDERVEGLIRYNHSSMLFDGSAEDYQIYNPSVGFRYTPRENTIINVSLGYYIQDRKIRGDESGFLVDSDIVTAWEFKQSSIQLNGSSGYDLSFLDETDPGFRLYYGAGLNIQYHFSRTLDGYLFSSYRWDDYPSGISSSDARRQDHNLEYGLGATYQILSWLSSRMQGSSRFLKSTIHENDYIDNRVLLSITISPSQPYRY